MPNTFTDSRALTAQELTRIGEAIAGNFYFPTAAGGATTQSSPAAMSVDVAAITQGFAVIDGTVSNVTMVADLVDSNGIVLGTPASKTYTAAEAVAAGVTGTQAQAFQAASNTLTANYQTSVLGA